ncbi:hypothetical protein H4R34_002342 [Dimargaris verticillata]|uniref:HMG box domain-containing protein n=1 Tax=Dimargaris verticillata TaxID=2761393 RepID=A0A9W8E9D8_9FUNG|nr:hypothetical protein H4R34_002342 [Dimargaris verticillata]
MELTVNAVLEAAQLPTRYHRLLKEELTRLSDLLALTEADLADWGLPISHGTRLLDTIARMLGPSPMTFYDTDATHFEPGARGSFPEKSETLTISTLQPGAKLDLTLASEPSYNLHTQPSQESSAGTLLDASPPSVGSQTQLAYTHLRGLSIPELLNPTDTTSPISASSGHTSPTSAVTVQDEGNSSGSEPASPKKTRRSYRRYPKEDVHAPKKPRNAYLTFITEHRSRVKEPDMSFGATAKILGKMWQELDPLMRQHYLDRYDAELKDYERAMAQYKQTPQYQQYQTYYDTFMRTEKKAPRPVGRPRKRPSKEISQQTFQVDLSSVPTINAPPPNRSNMAKALTNVRQPWSISTTISSKPLTKSPRSSPSHSARAEPYSPR